MQATKTKQKSFFRKIFFLHHDEGDDGKVADDDHRTSEDAQVHLGGLEGSHRPREAEEEAGARANPRSEFGSPTRLDLKKFDSALSNF